MKNRFKKVANKTYQDQVSKLFIYELLNAAEFGIAVWKVSRSIDGIEIKGVKGSTFKNCKEFIIENYPLHEKVEKIEVSTSDEFIHRLNLLTKRTLIELVYQQASLRFSEDNGGMLGWLREELQNQIYK